LFKIGTPGQGPGEVSRFACFYVDEKYVYLLDYPDKFMSFDRHGKHLKSFRLSLPEKQNYQRLNVRDMVVIKETIYVCYGVDQPYFNKFSLRDGSFLGQFGFPSQQELSGIGLDFQVFVDSLQSYLIVADNSRGRIFIFGLKAEKLISQIQEIDPAVKIEYQNFCAYFKDQKKGIYIAQLAKSSYDREDDQLYFLPILYGAEKLPVIFRYSLLDNLLSKIELKNLPQSLGSIVYILKVSHDQFIILDDLDEIILAKIGGKND